MYSPDFQVSQGDLFDDLPPSSKDMTDKFWDFHANNPHVYCEIVKLARQLKVRGHTRYAMKGIFEVIRYHRALATTDAEYKLNNNYTAYYARLAMGLEGDLADFFSVRESKAGEIVVA